MDQDFNFKKNDDRSFRMFSFDFPNDFSNI